MKNRKGSDYFNEEEDALLREWYPVIGAKGAIDKLNEAGYQRTTHSVMMRAYRLNVKSSLNRKTSPTTFHKGHTPWNKGEKMPDTVRKKVEKTFFKAGHEPHNTKHDGCISLRKDRKGRQYYWIRLAKAMWKMLHVHLWENENGPVPAGCIIVFRDRNALNCTLENLELITRKKHVMRNHNPKKVGSMWENPSDRQVIGRLTIKHPELREEVSKHTGLIQLARERMKLARAIKQKSHE